MTNPVLAIISFSLPQMQTLVNKREMIGSDHCVDIDLVFILNVQVVFEYWGHDANGMQSI